MKILGIDPGVATVGFGLLETSGTQQRILSCGVITTPAHTPLSSRLDRIYSDLEELIRSCDPEAISIEELFFSKNISGFLRWIQEALIKIETILYKIIR